MKISLSEHFQGDVKALSDSQQAQVFEVILSLPLAFREPQRHAGLGLRKLHASGIWEARIGLGLRLVISLEKGEVILLRVANHDEVRRYLRNL